MISLLAKQPNIGRSLVMFGIAAFPGSSAPRLVEVPPPRAPAPQQVLCRTLELGVCGTDREILASKTPWTPHGQEFLVLGHECLGEVIEAGRDVSGLSLGDLVVPVVRRPKPHATGRVDMLPQGQYTERGIAFEHGFSQPRWLDEPRYLFRIDPAIQSVAVLAEPLAVAEKAINEALVVQQARLGNGAWCDAPPRVLVTGMGPIGFAALLGARRRGWPATMYGRDAPGSFRANLAQQFGATYQPADSADCENPEANADSFDLVLECTGSEDVIIRTSAALAACGVMAWLGSSRAPQPRRLNLAHMVRDGLMRNHIHLGSVNAAPRDFEEALKTLAHFRANKPQALETLITARVAPQDSLWHFEHREPQGIKTVVEYEETETAR